jgi:cysteinyl-tRNA synthetase
VLAAVNKFIFEVRRPLTAFKGMHAADKIMGLGIFSPDQPGVVRDFLKEAREGRLLAIDRKVLRIRPKDAQLSLEHVEASIAFRKELRAQQNYPALDRLRDEIATQGVEVMDGDPLGWDWKLG